ncbi:hypothetical protein [Thalassospira alkalitolerans]|uniref:hypothetical protein n=1 Tax=Thalassospira alkalitolerans TaxID=1293890 RepID=UPI003AA7CEC0
MSEVKHTPLTDALKIVAMVRFNKGWAYVFDRQISFKYREETHGVSRLLVGRDGPIFDLLQYSKAGRHAKAFAGREFSLRMEDGSIRNLKDDWWSCGPPNEYDVTRITFSNITDLKRCYVYYGGYCDPEILAEMESEYENRVDRNGNRAGGWRYDYYDFEKVICYDDMRARMLKDVRHAERATASVIKEAKRWSQLVKAEGRS